MAFKGTLDSLSMTEVLQVISMAHKSGCMRLESPAGEHKQVYFQGGEIIAATSLAPKDRLGAVLMKMGLLTPEQLEASRSAEHATGMKQGSVLVENGVLTETELRTALTRQVREIFFSVMVWHEGSFEFVDGELPGPDVFRISASVTSLIMEGTRQLDEWSLIEKVFPSLDIVVSMSSPKNGSGGVHLQPEEWEILTLIDGKRTIREICTISSSSNFEVCKKLLALHHAGLVAKGPAKLASSNPPPPPTPSVRPKPQQLVPAGFAPVVREEFTRHVGPIANIVLEEVEANLGVTLEELPVSRIDEMVRMLRQEIDSPAKQQHFESTVREAAGRA